MHGARRGRRVHVRIFPLDRPSPAFNFLHQTLHTNVSSYLFPQKPFPFLLLTSHSWFWFHVTVRTWREKLLSPSPSLFEKTIFLNLSSSSNNTNTPYKWLLLFISPKTLSFPPPHFSLVILIPRHGTNLERKISFSILVVIRDRFLNLSSSSNNTPQNSIILRKRTKEKKGKIRSTRWPR